MRAKEWALVERCVETGVEYGYARALKHTDAPDAATLQGEIFAAVMNEIAEWFNFDIDLKDKCDCGKLNQ